MTEDRRAGDLSDLRDRDYLYLFHHSGRKECANPWWD